MTGVVRLAVKVVVAVTGAIVLGYVDYRIKGGKPIQKVYNEVKSERKEREEQRRTAKEGIELIEKGLKANG